MSDYPSTCRLCGGFRLESLGKLAPGDYFAGRVLPKSLPDGRLWHCTDCDSLFRHPILTSAEYRELYEYGAAGQWHSDAARWDVAEVRSALLTHPSANRVLDVGCGRGDFLASLPAYLERCGVEPAVDAGREAERRGIRIAAATLEELPGEARFDVITMVDVIEHIPEPSLFLETAFGHLAEGGLMIVSTGDPDIFLWRYVFRSRFWYSSFPEHISFPSRRFYDAWARARGGQLVAAISTRYRELPFFKAAVFWLIQGVYWVSPRLLDFVGRSLAVLARAPRPRRQHFSPGIAGVFRDHWVVVIRRLS